MKITVVEGDITVQEVDAVVNAANSSLRGGGGVDGAIHRAAGPELLAYCTQARANHWPDGLPAGEATITPGAQLPARYVIHTVGPNRHAGETDPAVLESCFRNSLKLAEKHGIKTVAFPAIGAGIYGWEAEEVAQAAARVLAERPEDTSVQEIRFVLFNARVADAFRTALSGPTRP